MIVLPNPENSQWRHWQAWPGHWHGLAMAWPLAWPGHASLTGLDDKAFGGLSNAGANDLDFNISD